MRFIYMLLFCLFSAMGFSQSFNYQAVVRDASNNSVTNQSIGVQIGIREGGPVGETLYFETHTVTSNAQGVISLAVGTGTSSGTLNDVDWSTQNQWLEISVDITGGTTYTNLGTTKLQQVPYALYAIKSGNTGPFSTTANVTSNASGDTTTDDFVFGSSQLADDINVEEDNRRLFFDKSKGAFRAGATNDSSRWDDTNIGFYSAAFGFENIASGSQSFASGGFNQVNRFYGAAIGHNNLVDGISASAIGQSLLSESYAQISIGAFNTGVSGTPNAPIAGDRLFVIGNGTAVHNRSDALVMLKNGNTTLNGELTTNGLKVNNLPSFAADLTNSIVITNANIWAEISNWTTTSATATQLHDDGNHFNESTGKFVAPVNGLYQFNSQVRIDAVTSGFVRLTLAVNGVPNLDGGFHTIKVVTADTLYQTLHVGGVMKLTEGDTVSLYVLTSADTNWTIQSESGFNGYLINKL
ncbi:hypothetical protein [uncultured Kordia sp.]|uniref:C1q-like domain-containing protein n=1 Tax=uncultured Kordia sp. TaxID=507699 RepID=UPI00260E6348|nr:hypothetical protein [uncultured Kordia sp.]